MFTRKPSKETRMRRAVERKIHNCEFNIIANEGINETVVQYYKTRKEVLEELIKQFDEM